MDRKARTMDQRRQLIYKIAGTHYQDIDDTAIDYLEVIEGGTNPTEQKQLFAYLMGIHNALAHHTFQSASQRIIPIKEWRKIADRVGSPTQRWSQHMLQMNQPIDQAASWLWDQLTLYEGNDRIVALHLILRSPLFPYTQLTPELTTHRPPETYETAKDRIIPQSTALHRVMMTELNIFQLAEVTVRQLEQIPAGDTDARVALLAHVFSHMFQRVQQADQAVAVLADLHKILSAE